MIKKMRKFEFVKRLENTEGLKLPERSTKNSAGYDFFAIEDVTIEPSFDVGIIKIPNNGYAPRYVQYFKKPILIKTGIKVKMEDDEVLLLVNRSSNPSKKNLIIPNSIGVIDAKLRKNKK